MVRRVLMIDDDVDDQEILASIIKEIDGTIEFQTAKDGVHGFEKLSANADYRPEIIFIDINMPRMDGMEFLAAVKEVENLADTRIIVYSTSSDESAIAACKKLGATSFISKTAYLDDVTALLTNLFK